MPIIIKDLNYVYNPKSPFSKQALKNINLSIEDGEFFGIIGHTGSGKSTLIQHLNALIKPASGSIFVNEFDLTDKKTDFNKLRSEVGMVFQYPEYQLFAETVHDDVAFGIKNFFCKGGKKKEGKPGAECANLSPQEITDMVRSAVTLVGLDYEKVKDKSPFELSGGQKRRVAIAGVIATRPKILVLDEPTAGLDPQGKKDILKLVHHLKAVSIPTIIMISHDMNEIAQNCTRIAVIKEGEIACVLPPQELFSDIKFIQDIGMDVPETVRLTHMLKAKGLSIGQTVFTAKELSLLIAQVLRAREGIGNA